MKIAFLRSEKVGNDGNFLSGASFWSGGSLGNSLCPATLVPPKAGSANEIIPAEAGIHLIQSHQIAQ